MGLDQYERTLDGSTPIFRGFKAVVGVRFIPEEIMYMQYVDVYNVPIIIRSCDIRTLRDDIDKLEQITAKHLRKVVDYILEVESDQRMKSEF